LLLPRSGEEALVSRILAAGEELCAPNLIDVEVVSALRRLASARAMTPARGAEAVEDLLALRLRRYPHEPLITRIWELRANLTAYDAAYVALAEALAATLLTRDKKLALAKGHRAKIELV
jgi:predicted nucleic acid-binding protein